MLSVRPRLALLAAFLVVLAAVPVAAGAGDLALVDAVASRLDPALAAQVVEAADDEWLPVMVAADDIETAKAAALDAQVIPMMTFDEVGVAAGWATPAIIDVLLADERVTYLEGDQPLAWASETSHKATRSDDVADLFRDGAGQLIDGSGVGIGIVDSGVDGTHPMFLREDGSSRVVRNIKYICTNNFPVPAEPYPDTFVNDTCFADIPSNDTDTPSQGGHGTHVSGIAGGGRVETADGRHLRGAAPGAELTVISTGQAIAVFGGNAAMNWILEHHANPCAEIGEVCAPIRVTNHSYGPTGGGAYNANSTTAKLQHAMVDAGIVVVWAAGNDGGSGSADVTNPSAKSPKPGVLSVANYDDGDIGTREGVLASTSSRGKSDTVATYPDISAPGSRITSACRPQLPICSSEAADPNYGTIGGTSMAAPHVAGIVATLLQANPDLTPGQIETVLLTTAHKFGFGAAYRNDTRAPGTGTTSFDKGHGLVDAAAALAAVLDENVPADGTVCPHDGPALIDETGDATGVVPTGDPHTDITGGRIETDPATRALTFTLAFDDLQDPPTNGSNGVWARFSFTYSGAAYDLEWFHLEPIQTIDLYDATGTAVGSSLSGSFDYDGDVLAAVLPAGHIAAAVPGAPGFTDGAPLSGLGGLAYHLAGGFGVVADTAGGFCNYRVNQENTYVPPTLTAFDASVDEGDSGTTDLTFTLALDGPVGSGGGSVRVRTEDAGATAGSDYTAVDRVVTFAPGSTGTTVSVAVAGDTDEEPDEAFTLAFSEPVGLSLAVASVTGTIANDDVDTSGPLAVTAVTPGCVAHGDDITITGSGFGASPGASYPILGGAPLDIVDWSDTQVVATVDADNPSGYAGVVVDGVTSNGKYVQVVAVEEAEAGPPALVGMSPDAGAPGTEVTFSGSGFGAAAGCGDGVVFNRVLVVGDAIVSWSDSEVVARVPPGVGPGYAGVVVNGVASNGRYFHGETTPPHVDTATPNPVAADETLTLTGTNFGDAADDDHYPILAGVRLTDIVSWSSTEVVVTVPAGSASGYAGIVVAGAASNGVYVTVDNGDVPTVTAMSPTSGPVGTQVTFDGSNFGAGLGANDGVMFNGVVYAAGDALSWSDTQVTIAVPSGATSGYAGIVRNGNVSNGRYYTVT